MPTLVVQITIGDYAKWRTGFDKAKPFRDKAGSPYASISQRRQGKRADYLERDLSLSKAREVLASPELGKAMQDAGVVGLPKIGILS